MAMATSPHELLTTSASRQPGCGRLTTSFSEARPLPGVRPAVGFSSQEPSQQPLRDSS
eukprot:CAMPEP_0204148508 /NCGR_PEP_ID=MMETSP0361-20130328/23606_1 /ASSEMBLY_ACC=CAM_ASM_000343 /TAXON_ID=268821 /ORGANISM="Scrippsiella Hangoei, Strain SHTV-5" /LENGTH=57 /DNA_ID=CAMNT_0051102861 /DNA_START=24 /DNA_END=194 /DNA_ORIENTATION=+